MSMSEQNPNMRRLQFEWYAALATIIGGFIIAIAVAAYLTFGGKAATQTAAVPPSQAEIQKARAAAMAQLGAELCGLELANAQTFGVDGPALPERLLEHTGDVNRVVVRPPVKLGRGHGRELDREREEAVRWPVGVRPHDLARNLDEHAAFFVERSG